MNINLVASDRIALQQIGYAYVFWDISDNSNRTKPVRTAEWANAGDTVHSDWNLLTVFVND
jgi:hypothetical protein